MQPRRQSTARKFLTGLTVGAVMLLGTSGAALADAGTPQVTLSRFTATYGDYVRSGGGIPSAEMRARFQPVLAPALVGLLEEDAETDALWQKRRANEIEPGEHVLSEDLFLETTGANQVGQAQCRDAEASDTRVVCDIVLTSPAASANVESKVRQRVFLVEYQGRWVVEDIDRYEDNVLAGRLRSRLRAISALRLDPGLALRKDGTP